MCVGTITLGHLLDGAAEPAFAVEDVGILGKEAENQPGEKVVEIMPASGGVPSGIVLQQFDVEAVEPAGGFDVERIFADLLDGCDARQWQKETEMVVKVGVGASNRFPIDKIFGFKVFAIGGEDELGLLFCGGTALSQRGKGDGHFAISAYLDVNVVPLKHTTGQVGLVGVAALKAFEGGFFVAEGFKEGIREGGSVKWRIRKLGNGFFDFDCIHSTIRSERAVENSAADSNRLRAYRRVMTTAMSPKRRLILYSFSAVVAS
jgi:hypothetical protein